MSSNRLNLAGLTMTLMKSALAAGTTTTVSTTGTTHYLINGKAYTKAALTNATTPTTDVNTGAAFERIGAGEIGVFVLGFNANGDLKCAQGSVEDLDANYDTKTAPQFPVLPDDFSPIGYLTIKAGSTAAAKASGWLFGSSNMASVTGITYAFASIGVLPNRPQIA